VGNTGEIAELPGAGGIAELPAVTGLAGIWEGDGELLLLGPGVSVPGMPVVALAIGAFGSEDSLATGVGVVEGLGLAPVNASQLVSKNNVANKISLFIKSPDLNTTQIR
jgi:hypothetical protein